MKTPAEILQYLYKKNKFLTDVFGITYLFGFVVHIYMFTNKFFNYFELGNIFSDMSFFQGDTIAQGRWFLPIATNLFTGFSMPLLNGLISLFYVTASAVMVVDLLKFKSKLCALLFAFTLAAFPGYTCVLAYGVNADAIACGFFLCVLGVYLYEKFKFGWIGAVICIGCGLGAYQTYLSASIGIIYMLLFFQAYEEKIQWKPYLLRTGKALCMLAGGFIVYYGMLKLSVVLTGVSLTDYHGVDSMTSFTPKGIAKGLVYTYYYFLSYFFSNKYLYTIGKIVWNVAGGLVCFVLASRQIAVQKKAGNTLSAVMIGVLICLLPLGVNATPFLMADRVGAGVDRYMIFSIMFLWAVLMKMLDIENDKNAVTEGCDRDKRWCSAGCVIQWIGIASVVAAVVGSVVICNQAYHRMEAVTQTTASYLNRIAARLEEMPEWQEGMPVYFANTKSFMSSMYDVEQPAYEAMTNMPGTELSPHYNERGIARYFKTYLHFPIVDAEEEIKLKIEDSSKFQAMPAYPQNGSIEIIDGVIVIKLCESEEES